MVVKRYGNIAAPSWSPSDSDERDKGVIRFAGAAVEDINLTLGFGQTSSTCSISLVEEEEGVFKEPEIGSAGRVAVPNEQGGNPNLYDSSDANYTMSFIGIIRSINNIDGTNGRNKVVEFLDTKEILKNIPVMLNDIGDSSANDISIINNFTNAYKRSAKSGKGLDISAVSDAVSNKTYTYYPNNIKGNTVFFQSYEIDMSRMFYERTKTTFSEEIFYGSIDGFTDGRFKNGYDDGKFYSASTRDKFDNLFGDGERDEDFDNISFYPSTYGEDRYADEEKFIVSPSYKVEGEARNLLDIIDDAMTKNGCDWYVRAYEKSSPNSIVTGLINGTIVVQIIPVVRNDFDQFTENEFQTFIDGLDDVESSKTFGKEFANEDSNKIFFGSKWESLQRVPVQENPATDDIMKRFWGFEKNPAMLGNDTREIVDRYGNSIRAVSGINENPTFDTTSLSGVDFTDELLDDTQLLYWLISVFGYERDEIFELTREQKIALIESSSEYNDYYTFNLNDSYQKFTFYLLSNLYKRKDTFCNLLLNIYNYVEYYDKNKEGEGIAYIKEILPNEQTYDTSGFSSVNFCGNSISAGSTISQLVLSSDYDAPISLSFVHSLSSISTSLIGTADSLMRGKYSDITTSELVNAGNNFIVKGAIQIYINNVMIHEINSYGGNVLNDIYIDIPKLMQNFLNKEESANGLNTLYYGLNEIELRAKVSGRLEKDKNKRYVDFFKFYVQWFGKEGNPYDLMRNNPLYLWARAAGIAFLKNEQVMIDYNSTIKALRKFTGDTKSGVLLWGKNQDWHIETFKKRLDSLHSVVSSYLDSHIDKKYYKKLNSDEWDVAPEVWDGEAGYTITDPQVRGAFLNKQTGKMPCLYRIKYANVVETNQEEDNVLYIKKLDDSGEQVLNLYGVAQAELFAVGKTPNEASDNRYLICTMNYAPKRTKKKQYRADDEVESLEAIKRGDSINARDTTDTEKALEEFIDEVFNESDIGYLNAGVDAKLSADRTRPTLRITPLAFYVPTIHSFIRYGPWILDGRNLALNRSNYGITGIEIDDSLNPWDFKSYGDVQNYVLDQNKNTLMTEYRLNRGQVVTADIPRFNIGRKIGKFSNISGISVSYGANGVSTTYTLTAFGAGEQTREQREKQEIYKRIRNIDLKTPKVGMNLTTEQINQMLNGRSFK